ncbi:SidA/IucD/PvdA family monooxygenase [Bacillus mangrovi]|uniref:L-lysine N6-monooxygenase MbtG n=1 Tax=Metabacillus mangrovi TaxID=1491830 RepID=A0A7X2V6L0_9BACI|nr:SidA/IucD/PvdA family monooxygenase [Metabacillus mangrovi]MTH55289.1 SidA/IucD/PvdA family monooxygenase [Metabacillus mangrovi]
MKMYDVIGIGLGPSNLSLAALLEESTGLQALFFEEKESFTWHPGLLLEETTLQVPFMADLVTMANPRSEYTFLNYLKETGKLYLFFSYNEFTIPRAEYNQYLTWAANKLGNIRYSSKAVNVELDEKGYIVTVFNAKTKTYIQYFAHHIVMGTGQVPNVPVHVNDEWRDRVFPALRYAFKREELLNLNHITVVGSGQSAAEIFFDLMEHQNSHSFTVEWITRSPALRELETTKFRLEMFTPAYVQYFEELSFEKRKEGLAYFYQLRNGINPETLDKIYRKLYHRSLSSNSIRASIRLHTELESIEHGFILNLKHLEEERSLSTRTDAVILATGLKPNIPHWFHENFSHLIEWESDQHYKVGRDYSLSFKEPNPHHFFILTGLDQSHGTASTNLKLSVFRNQLIINKLAGYELFKIESTTSFQSFSSAVQGDDSFQKDMEVVRDVSYY